MQINKKIAVGYARYSTDAQTENSIAYQSEHIERYCSENNLELKKIYADTAVSGTNTDRPAFLRLLKDAEKHLFSTVVIYDVTRGSRDVGDWFTFRKKMLSLGIEVVSISQKLGDITNSGDFLAELISVGMGQSEVLNNRKKSIDGVAVKAKQGAFLGGSPPLGYTVTNGKYTVCEEEARTVRKIFSMYADGKSYDEMLRELRGVKGKYGRPLGKNSFVSILKNERYIGVYTWNKRKYKMLRKWAGGEENPDCVRIENAMPQIIETKLWEEVQKRLNSKQNASNKAKRTYLLSGLIKCDLCGAAFVGHTSKNSKGYEHKSYICGNKYRTHTCGAKNINAGEIEAFTVAGLKNYFSEANIDGIAEKTAEIIKNTSASLEKEKKELAEVNRKIANGVNAILGGAEIEELQTEIEKLKLKKTELEEIISLGEQDSRNIKNITKDDVKRMLEEMRRELASSDISRETIKRAISAIYAHPDGTYTVCAGVHLDDCAGAH